MGPLGPRLLPRHSQIIAQLSELMLTASHMLKGGQLVLKVGQLMLKVGQLASGALTAGRRHRGYRAPTLRGPAERVSRSSGSKGPDPAAPTLGSRGAEGSKLLQTRAKSPACPTRSRRDHGVAMLEIIAGKDRMLSSPAAYALRACGARVRLRSSLTRLASSLDRLPAARP